MGSEVTIELRNASPRLVCAVIRDHDDGAAPCREHYQRGVERTVASVVPEYILITAANRHETTHAHGSEHAKRFVRPFVGAAVLGLEGGF